MTETDKKPVAGYVQDPDLARRARELFAKADQVPDPDYAISLYLQGLELFPDAAEEGHQKLMESALRRKQRGGKPPGMLAKMKFEAIKLTLGKNDPRGGMLEVERNYWAKDPTNLDYMEVILRCALAAGFHDTVRWVCPIMLDLNKRNAKPLLRIFDAIASAYENLEMFDKAVEAFEPYCQIKKDDAEAVRRLKNYQARKAMQQGRYERDFTESRRDDDYYEDEVFAKDTHKIEAKVRAVETAKAQLEQDPDNVAKIRRYANALFEIGDEASENTGIQTLEEAHKRLGDYTLKQRADDIRMRQIDRRNAEMQKKLQADPTNEALKKEAIALVADSRKRQLEVWLERHQQYPTDMEILYHLGIQYFNNKLYDDAIPAFQQAQNEPKRQIDALYYLGMSFARNGLVEAAIDEFKEAIGRYEIEKDDRSKRLHYALATCYEQTSQFKEAGEEYKLLARWDYNYRDVRDRMKGVSEKIRAAGA
jgi:tetratricopeptide (TPR) repeat protein